MASIAEFERRQTAERISHSFLARAKRGLYNGGSVPLGYMVDPDKPGTLRIVPEEAELVKLFFQTFLREQTLAATAKWLNSNKIAVPRRVRGGGSIRGKNVRILQLGFFKRRTDGNKRQHFGSQSLIKQLLIELNKCFSIIAIAEKHIKINYPTV